MKQPFKKAKTGALVREGGDGGHELVSAGEKGV
jgi:dihydroxyacetone kinase